MGATTIHAMYVHRKVWICDGAELEGRQPTDGALAALNAISVGGALGTPEGVENLRLKKKSKRDGDDSSGDSGVNIDGGSGGSGGSGNITTTTSRSEAVSVESTESSFMDPAPRRTSSA